METENPLPALQLARNVASTVRSGFFKEFDENLLRTISSVCYEDDTTNLPSPDVGNFLTSENAGFVRNGVVNAPLYEGIAGAEVDRSWNDHKNTTVDTSTPFGNNYRDPRPGASLQPVTISQNSFGDAAYRTFASLQSIPIVHDIPSDCARCIRQMYKPIITSRHQNMAANSRIIKHSQYLEFRRPYKQNL